MARTRKARRSRYPVAGTYDRRGRWLVRLLKQVRGKRAGRGLAKELRKEKGPPI